MDFYEEALVQEEQQEQEQASKSGPSSWQRAMWFITAAVQGEVKKLHIV